MAGTYIFDPKSPQWIGPDEYDEAMARVSEAMARVIAHGDRSPALELRLTPDHIARATEVARGILDGPAPIVLTQPPAEFRTWAEQCRTVWVTCAGCGVPLREGAQCYCGRFGDADGPPRAPPVSTWASNTPAAVAFCVSCGRQHYRKGEKCDGCAR